MLSAKNKLGIVALTGTLLMVLLSAGCDEEYALAEVLGYNTYGSSFGGYDVGYDSWGGGYYDEPYYTGGYYYQEPVVYDDCFSCYDDWWYY